MPDAATRSADHDLTDPQVVIDLFEQAAEANLSCPDRSGAVVDLEEAAGGRLLMTGDLHDHGLNFHRILKLADLDGDEMHRVVLHEMIHGPGRVNGRDLSIRMLARAAALKGQYPRQVYLLQSNHELAQLNNEGILKNGVSQVDAFDAGVDFLYDDQADAVREAMNAFIRSFPLMVRCANGVMCCHSLPSPRKIETFDKQVLERTPTDADLTAANGGGDAYQMVWGRHHTQKVADELSAAWGMEDGIFVMGHQPAEMGYERQGQSMLILASDHEHGVALPIQLDRRYTRDELAEQIVPLASVVL